MQFYPHPFSLEDSRRWIERMQEWYVRDGFSLLAVEDHQTNEFLGNVGLIVPTVDGVNVLLASLDANTATETPSTPARCHSRP